MIIQDQRIKAKCPECGSENVKSKWSFATIVAWLGRILGVPTVKIWEKTCVECGHEFQIFRNSGVSMMAGWRKLSMLTKIFYICGLVSLVGLAIIILTGMTSIGGEGRGDNGHSAGGSGQMKASM